MKKTLFTQKLLAALVAVAAIGFADGKELYPGITLNDGDTVQGESQYTVRREAGLTTNDATVIAYNKVSITNDVSGSGNTLVTLDGGAADDGVTVGGAVSGNKNTIVGFLDTIIGEISGDENNVYAGRVYDTGKWATPSNDRDLKVGTVSGNGNSVSSIGYVEVGDVTGEGNVMNGSTNCYVTGTAAGSYNTFSAVADVSVNCLAGDGNVVSARMIDIGHMDGAQNAELTSTAGPKGIVRIGYTGEASTGTNVSISANQLEMHADVTLTSSTVSVNELEMKGNTLTLTGDEVNLSVAVLDTGKVVVKDATVGTIDLGYYGFGKGADLVLENVTLTDNSLVQNALTATLVGDNRLELTTLPKGVTGIETGNVGMTWYGLDGVSLADDATLTVYLSMELLKAIGLTDENSEISLSLTLAGLNGADLANLNIDLPSGWVAVEDGSEGGNVKVVISAVPEPTTATLSLLALAALAARRRRR